MTKFIRYALAFVFFAASVGCLALWIWSVSDKSRSRMVSYYSADGAYHGELFNGQLHAYFAPESMRWTEYIGWLAISQPTPEGVVDRRLAWTRFGRDGHGGYIFPALYASLIFALAGVAALHCRRQFSIRSALICVSVVASLLGIVVVL
jgi:hypothetical protein